MALKNSITLTTRVSDLDFLRHVNNKVYEQLCAEGRYRLLEEQGYSIETLMGKGIALRPMASFVKFALQQKSGATLNVQTEAIPLGNGVILWNHQITQPDGKTVCQVQAKTETLESLRKPVELLPATDEPVPQILIEDIPDFSGKCSRITTSYSVIYTDMDTFGNLPIAAYWRIFEEGRHLFGGQLGLTLDKLVQFNTHLFWVAGTYQYYQPVRAGQPLMIHTWLERIVKIRAYIRQEIRSADGAKLLGASREEHLIVSLTEARPREIPPEMATIVNELIEFQNQPAS